jgi:hypothetical protein
MRQSKTGEFGTAGSTMVRRLGKLALLVVALALADAHAMSLKVAYDSPGSLLYPDLSAGVLRRADAGETLPLYLKEDGTAAPVAWLYFIPQNVVAQDGFPVANVDVRFRLEDIPLDCQSSNTWIPRSIIVSGLSDTFPVASSWRLGTGTGDFVEFVISVRNQGLTWIDSTLYVDISSFGGTFSCQWWTRLSVKFLTPFAISDYEPPGVEPSVIDRWFKLEQYKWPDSFVDGMQMPPAIYVTNAPLAGETVEISGSGLVFAPSSAVTDDNGVFGVVAFVDPASFPEVSPDPAPARSKGPGKAGAQSSDLSLSYKQVIKKRKIEGHYAEVIQLEGTVTDVSGSGASIKVGDFLLPGTVLSLSAKYGEPAAQLGLRFINGADASLTAMAFTNACIADLIEIGHTGFKDKSVIQGKTALASVTRWLCEQSAGLPNTPAEWGLTTGKFIVSLGASSLVPVPMGYEVSGFVVKWFVVGTATGKVVDLTFGAPGDYRRTPRPATELPVPKAGSGRPRFELSTYYDGSVRLAENFPGAFSIYDSDSPTPFVTSASGVWQEFKGVPAVAGRAWSETPDSIDKEGPVLRLSANYIAQLDRTDFQITATDLSGLDPSSLSVTVDGVGDVTPSFSYRGHGLWLGQFWVPLPQSFRMHVSLADAVGNRTVLDWIGDQRPLPPRNLAAYYTGGRTWVEWDLPAGMAAADLLFYEVRQGSGSTLGAWQSVGSANRVLLDLMSGLGPSATYFFEVRAWTATGMVGASSRTSDIAQSETTARLDVGKTGTGSGTVTGPDINCGSDCVGFYTLGSTASLTAAPAAGSTFDGWGGACTGTGACTVTMAAARSVTAAFSLLPVVAALSPSPTALDFGGQSMNTTAPAQAVTISNTTGVVVTVGAVTTTLPFAVTHNCATLAASASCTANVTFTPATEGAITGTLTISSDVGTQTVSLSGTGERSLVTHYYRSILRRAPDPGGKAYWEGIPATMQSWGANVNETWYSMATFFFFSAEYASFQRSDVGFVTDLYAAFFNRAPDPGGFTFWTGQLAQGVPREVVLVSFLFSGEFTSFTRALFGNTAARAEVDTVMDFYRGLLSRLPDAGGFNNWVSQFRAAQCAGGPAVLARVETISRQFATSAEYLGRSRTTGQYVGDLYNAFLRRGGDREGVQSWISQIDTGARSRENVRQQFRDSMEFSARVNAIIAQGCLP